MTSGKSGGAVIPGITTFAAAAIVIADMVGVGVFTSLGFQVQTVSSGFALILLWVVGGIVAFCGATCYAELAGMFPRSSGEYNFLHRTYHSSFGFIAGWLSATVGFAAPVAGANEIGCGLPSAKPAKTKTTMRISLRTVDTF